MRTPAILPDLGSLPVSCSLWLVPVGEVVREGERLVEVLVEGATFDIASPVTGRLVERKVAPRDRLKSGQVLAVIEMPLVEGGARGMEHGES